jgi:hypothetical protein
MERKITSGLALVSRELYGIGGLLIVVTVEVISGARCFTLDEFWLQSFGTCSSKGSYIVFSIHVFSVLLSVCY